MPIKKEIEFVIPFSQEDRYRHYHVRIEMSERELIEKNMTLNIEFSKYIFEHPKFEDKIPKGAQVVLLPEDDEELSAYNLMIAEKQREKGQPVVYVKIEKLLAPRLSRVSKAALEVKSGTGRL